MSNKVVYKYSFGFLNAIKNGQYHLSLDMHKGAQILNVAYQGGGCCVWALVDPEQKIEKRAFYSVGTGWGNVLEGSRHIATVIDNYKKVWHIFEEV